MTGVGHYPGTYDDDGEDCESQPDSDEMQQQQQTNTRHHRGHGRGDSYPPHRRGEIHQRFNQHPDPRYHRELGYAYPQDDHGFHGQHREAYGQHREAYGQHREAYGHRGYAVDDHRPDLSAHLSSIPSSGSGSYHQQRHHAAPRLGSRELHHSDELEESQRRYRAEMRALGMPEDANERLQNSDPWSAWRLRHVNQDHGSPWRAVNPRGSVGHPTVAPTSIPPEFLRRVEGLTVEGPHQTPYPSGGQTPYPPGSQGETEDPQEQAERDRPHRSGRRHHHGRYHGE